jgi:uncharacterized protein (DUF1499 family)
MAWLRWLAGVATLAALLPIAIGQAGLLRGKPPADMGVRDGRLEPPSTTPNSVTSQADLWPGHPQRAYAGIAPFAFTGDGANALGRLRAAVEATPGARVVEARADYLRAEFETRWLRFTDDAEFWLDQDAGLIHLRSASRLGRWDFGVNRARAEALRARLAASATGTP